MFSRHLEYVGGDVLNIPEIDVGCLCFMDISNVVQDELGYRDNGTMYYKFDQDKL